jgi:hypothetical protein
MMTGFAAMFNVLAEFRGTVLEASRSNAFLMGATS